jgi:hypothetical protein
MNAKVRELAKQPRIIDGVQKLQTLSERKPRHSLRSVKKQADHKTKVNDALKQLLFIYKHGLRHYFLKWKEGTELAVQKDGIVNVANKCMALTPAQKLEELLVRKPLRHAFNRIRDAKKRLIGKIWLFLQSGAEARARHALLQLLRNATGHKYELLRKICGWRAVNLAGIFFDQLKREKTVNNAA